MQQQTVGATDVSVGHRTGDRCPSCGAGREGVFCPRCGERRLRTDEFELRRFLSDAVRELVGGGGSRLWRSLKLLAVRPGRLTVEHLRGRRTPYLSPLQLFLLANLVYFLVQPLTIYTGFNTTLESQVGRQPYSGMIDLRGVVETRIAERGLDFTTYAQLYDLQSGNYAATLVILMVPLLALILAGLFAARRRPLAHHLVFAFHYYAWVLLFMSSLFLLVWGWLYRGAMHVLHGAGIDVAAAVEAAGTPGTVLWLLITELTTTPFLLAYFYLATRRVYDLSRLTAAGAAIILLPASLLVTLVYRLLLFWITFATV